MNELVEIIPHMRTERHAKAIKGLIEWLRPVCVVEIGPWRGYVTAHIAKAVKNNRNGGKVYAIENYAVEGADAAGIHNSLQMLGLADIVGIIPAVSQDIDWPDADFVVIDGDHREEPCQKDLDKAMRTANCIVMHDTCNNVGPRAVIDKFRSTKNKDWDLIEANFDEGLTVLMRRFPKPAPQYKDE